MDLNEYHKAWMNGCSESESVRRGEEKWLEDQYQQSRTYKDYDVAYFDELEKQIEEYISDNTIINCNWCDAVVKHSDTDEIDAVYAGEITGEKERVCRKCLAKEY
jgi:hypothetical protein